MDIKARIGLRIKELRTKKKLTQEGVAFKAEVDRTYMNHVENGRRNISVAVLERIINALGIGVDEFFANEVFITKKEAIKS